MYFFSWLVAQCRAVASCIGDSHHIEPLIGRADSEITCGNSLPQWIGFRCGMPIVIKRSCGLLTQRIRTGQLIPIGVKRISTRLTQCIYKLGDVPIRVKCVDGLVSSAVKDCLRIAIGIKHLLRSLAECISRRSQSSLCIKLISHHHNPTWIGNADQQMRQCRVGCIGELGHAPYAVGHCCQITLRRVAVRNRLPIRIGSTDDPPQTISG